MVLLNAAGVRKKADGNLSIVAMTFLIVRVDHGVRNLIPWFMVPVEPHEQNQTLIGYHSRLISGKVDAAISIDEEFYDIPASFQAADSEVGPWMMISSMCKLESVLLMKKTHVRITLHSPIQARKPLEKKDAFEVMRQRSKDRVLPDLKPTTAIKNRKKGLWNAIVKWLATMSVGWNRDEVASAGNLFVTTMTEIFWYISEGEAKLASRSCAIPLQFKQFLGFNQPETSTVVRVTILPKLLKDHSRYVKAARTRTNR